MEIRSIPSTVQGPQGLDALGATAAPPPAPAETPSKALEPAVKLDIGNSSEKARFIRDVDSRAIVFQVVDTPTGTVIAQLPSESALRNRAYTPAPAQRASEAGLSRVA
jgi:hypothetical protein